jgi:hypothetical protein
MSDHNASQRLVLRYVLDAHPRLLDLGDLERSLEGVPRVREAVNVLVGDGLATRLGDRVGATRAAIRFELLTSA